MLIIIGNKSGFSFPAQKKFAKAAKDASELFEREYSIHCIGHYVLTINPKVLAQFLLHSSSRTHQKKIENEINVPGIFDLDKTLMQAMCGAIVIPLLRSLLVSLGLFGHTGNIILAYACCGTDTYHNVHFMDPLAIATSGLDSCLNHAPDLDFLHLTHYIVDFSLDPSLIKKQKKNDSFRDNIAVPFGGIGRVSNIGNLGNLGNLGSYGDDCILSDRTNFESITQSLCDADAACLALAKDRVKQHIKYKQENIRFKDLEHRLATLQSLVANQDLFVIDYHPMAVSPNYGGMRPWTVQLCEDTSHLSTAHLSTAHLSTDTAFIYASLNSTVLKRELKNGVTSYGSLQCRGTRCFKRCFDAYNVMLSEFAQNHILYNHSTDYCAKVTIDKNLYVIYWPLVKLEPNRAWQINVNTGRARLLVCADGPTVFKSITQDHIVPEVAIDRLLTIVRCKMPSSIMVTEPEIMWGLLTDAKEDEVRNGVALALLGIKFRGKKRTLCDDAGQVPKRSQTETKTAAGIPDCDKIQHLTSTPGACNPRNDDNADDDDDDDDDEKSDEKKYQGLGDITKGAADVKLVQQVARLFRNTILELPDSKTHTAKVISIRSVVNHQLAEEFLLLRKQNSITSADRALCCFGFHGTRSTQPNPIVVGGIDPRYSATGGHLFLGQAAYISSSAAYCHQGGYARPVPDHVNTFEIFCACFLPGITLDDIANTPEARARRVPPTGYDSVTSIVDRTRIWALYERRQMYPMFLLTYTYSPNPQV